MVGTSTTTPYSRLGFVAFTRPLGFQFGFPQQDTRRWCDHENGRGRASRQALWKCLEDGKCGYQHQNQVGNSPAVFGVYSHGAFRVFIGRRELPKHFFDVGPLRLGYVLGLLILISIANEWFGILHLLPHLSQYRNACLLFKAVFHRLKTQTLSIKNETKV